MGGHFGDVVISAGLTIQEIYRGQCGVNWDTHDLTQHESFDICNGSVL